MGDFLEGNCVYGGGNLTSVAVYTLEPNVVVVADGQNTVVEVKMSVVVVVYGMAGMTLVLVQPQSVMVEVSKAVRV